VNEFAERLEGRQPKVLIALGSGLGELADAVADPLVVPFADIGLPVPTVPGHAGRLVVGELFGKCVVMQQGRLHLYEGVPVADVTAVVRAAADVGVGTFIVTNAAGGLRESMNPGDIVVLSDHLNLTAHNPLVGIGGEPHFVNLSDAYDVELRRLAIAVGERHGRAPHEGVYAGLVGPSYETPAEITMLRTLGADVVGMSTVSEVIQARALGMRVAGFSLVTNVHRPGGTPTDHDEVLAAAKASGPHLAALIREVLTDL
jgi:purine-nucleoside phosphorylase